MIVATVAAAAVMGPVTPAAIWLSVESSRWLPVPPGTVWLPVPGHEQAPPVAASLGGTRLALRPALPVLVQLPAVAPAPGVESSAPAPPAPAAPAIPATSAQPSPSAPLAPRVANPTVEFRVLAPKVETRSVVHDEDRPGRDVDGLKGHKDPDPKLRR